MELNAGSTNQSIYFDILDSTSTTGGRKTGLVFNSASLTAYYVRQGGAAVAITLATLAAANSAYSSGGFKEVDATNAPGNYRLDVPDAAFAAGVGSVLVVIKGATGMAQATKEITLRAVPDVNITKWLGATPNALQSGRVDSYLGAIASGVIAAGSFAAGAFDAVWTVTTRTLSSFGTLVADIWANATRTLSAFGFNVTVATNNDKTGYALTAPYDPAKTAAQAGDAMALTTGERTSVGTAVWATTTRTLSSFGTLVSDVATAVWGAVSRTLTAGTNIVLAKGVGVTGFNDLDAAGIRAAVGLAAANLDTQLSATKAVVDAIKAKTDNLPTDPADQSDLVALLNAIIGYVDTEVAAIKAKTDTLPADPADASDVAGQFVTLTGLVNAVDALATAIKAKTDNLPTDPADQSLVIAATDALLVAVNTRLATAGYTAPDNAGITAISAVTTKLNAMIEADGGDFRFDTNALEMAPGGGGGALSVEQAAQLAAIAAKTALLGTQGVTVIGPVTQKGELDIIKGYEYTLSSGFAPRWSSDAWPNLDGATISLVEYQSPHTQIATGSVVVFGSGTQTVALSMPGALTGALVKGTRKTLLQAILSGQTNPVPLAEVTLNVNA